MNTRTEGPTFSRVEWSELDFIFPPFYLWAVNRMDVEAQVDEVELRPLNSAKRWPLCPSTSIHALE